MNLQEFKQGVQNNAIDSLFCCGDAADKMAKVTSSKIRSNVVLCIVLKVTSYLSDFIDDEYRRVNTFILLIFPTELDLELSI